jgi:pimeloyl-ACP methyl ester carboxylesterase
MDALGIEKAILAGYDWGARTANVIAALWPERWKALVSVSGYLIGSPEANRMPLPPKAELQWWLVRSRPSAPGLRSPRPTGPT